MKKLLKFFLLTFILTFCLTTSVYAEKCKVVSGTGKEIGDEIACGTENFYVMDYTDNSLKLLAKYNLYIGKNYYSYKLEEEIEDLSYSEFDGDIPITNSDLVNSLLKKYYGSGLYSEYYFIYDYNRLTWVGSTKTYHCLNVTDIIFYNEIDEDDELYGKQNSIALGATGTELGKPNPEENALMPNLFLYDDLNFVKLYENYYSTDLDYYEDWYEFPSFYIKYLNSNGYTVDDVSIPTIKDINDTITKSTGKELPLGYWLNNWQENRDIVSFPYDSLDYYIVGDLKDYTNDKLKFLYSTTYWLNTVSILDKDEDDYTKYYGYFIDTLGYVCTTDDCSEIGAGVRPMVTMNADQVYNVYTKVDGNGNVSYDYEDGKVIFKLIPEEGYVLGEVKVTDANGNSIAFTDYTFTMPSADVTIEAIFKKIDNPITSTGIKILIVVTMLLAGLSVYLNTKKYNKILK